MVASAVGPASVASMRSGSFSLVTGSGTVRYGRGPHAAHAASATSKAGTKRVRCVTPVEVTVMYTSCPISGTGTPLAFFLGQSHARTHDGRYGSRRATRPARAGP